MVVIVFFAIALAGTLKLGVNSEIKEMETNWQGWGTEQPLVYEVGSTSSSGSHYFQYDCHGQIHFHVLHNFWRTVRNSDTATSNNGSQLEVQPQYLQHGCYSQMHWCHDYKLEMFSSRSDQGIEPKKFSQ